MLNIKEVIAIVNHDTERELSVVDIHQYAGKGWLNVAHKPGRPKPNGYALQDVSDFIDRLNALDITGAQAVMSIRLDRSISWGHINTACNADIGNTFHIGQPARFPLNTLGRLELNLREQLGMEVEE